MQELSVRQKQIISTSIKIIAERGIQELTMKNLAGEVGISEPALYRHFPGKQKILITMLSTFKNQNKLINEVAPPHGITELEHLNRVIGGILDKFIENPTISAVIFSDEIFHNASDLSEMILDIMNSHTDFIKNLIKRGQADGSIRSDIDTRELGVIVMGAVRHLVSVWRLSGFSFDLRKSGKKMLVSLELMIGT